MNFGDTIVTIPNGITLESFIEPKIETELIGPSTVRGGVWNTYIVKYKNTGNVDVGWLPIFISIASSAQYEIREN